MKQEIQNFTKVITTEFAGGVKEGKSHHLTLSPSPEIGEGGKVKSRLTFKKRAAFTLAETLITVVILGILAAILVPNLIKNQVENANRTKVKKAMAAYEKAINYMIIENDIRETEALRELGQDNCQYTREYFKTVKDGENNCIFKTADRVWWDITDITNPILILKNSQLDKSSTELRTLAKNLSDKTVFAMVGRFDDIGTLRINDNGFEQSQKNNLTNQKYMKKLWYYITQSDSALNEFEKCKVNKQEICKVTDIDGEEVEYKLISLTVPYNKNLCVYDRETKSQNCDYVSVATPGDYYIRMNPVPSADEPYTSGYCSSSLVTAANACKWPGDYWQAAKLSCEAAGARLASAAEIYTLGNQGVIPKTYYWASEESNKDTFSGYYVRTDYPNISSTPKNFRHNALCIGD